MPTQNIKDTLASLELEVAKQKAVFAAFPDAKVSAYGEFSSKAVNKAYTNISFIQRWKSLYVEPFCQVEFSFNGLDYSVNIHSSPARQRLAYVSWNYQLKNQEVRFSRLHINMKTHSFKDEMLSDCQSEIVGFIKKFPNIPINDKHLDARLKKLISFL